MRHILVLTALLCVHNLSQAQEKGEVALTVAPGFKWLTEATPYGSLRLTNDGTSVSEITITTHSLGDSLNAAPAIPEPSRIGDIANQLTLFPPRLILEPGETRVVRYSIRDVHSLPIGGHVALVRVHLLPRTPVSQSQTPSAAAALSINYALLVPLVLIRESGTPEIRVRIVLNTPDKLTVALENEGDSPWAGNIHVESVDGLTLYGSSPAVLFGEKEVEISLSAPIQEPVRFVFDEKLPTMPEHILRTPAPITLTF